jgi:2-polyprenyl-3-methyl-5-hydroxy-6-metoxy-1,4-benzoquinol methylase
MIPLNQIYKQRQTFEQYPKIKETFDDITEHSIKNNFIRFDQDNQMIIKGRRYDDAVIINSDIDFNGKTVCDLGARDGILGAYLTKYVDKIYVSDYFEEWGKGTEHDLGSIEHWTNIWENAAFDKNKLVIENQDMTKLTYPDNFFDIVISTSVIEHIYNQANWTGDMIAMKEMVRICKPGGIIAVTTDMARESRWVSGTFYYSIEDIFKRLIDHSGCELRGEYNFDINDTENDAISSHNDLYPVSSVIFTLKKPDC